LRHLKVHPRFISLCLRIAVNKENQIITAYGLTDAYSPQCGLDQGGVECPLLWRIVYDVLLSEIMNAGLGYPMMRREALAEHHKIPFFMPETPDIEVMIACLAFVDDSTWIGRDQECLQGIVDIAMSFFALNAIEINPKKSELLVINSATDDSTIQLGNDTIEALDPATSARMLGVWFSADGKGVHTKQIVKQEVSSICKVLARKAITDKQAIYIVNNVLIPRILYRLTTTILTPHEINKI
ncbi:hypothetical protein BGX20_007273, partial [Mortierella sp. AD010]